MFTTRRKIYFLDTRGPKGSDVGSTQCYSHYSEHDQVGVGGLDPVQSVFGRQDQETRNNHIKYKHVYFNIITNKKTNLLLRTINIP